MSKGTGDVDEDVCKSKSGANNPSGVDNAHPSHIINPKHSRRYRNECLLCCIKVYIDRPERYFCLCLGSASSLRVPALLEMDVSWMMEMDGSWIWLGCPPPL